MLEAWSNLHEMLVLANELHDYFNTLLITSKGGSFADSMDYSSLFLSLWLTCAYMYCSNISQRVYSN